MAVAARQSPTVRRRRLGLELRRLRETAGLTIEKVADRLECSDSKVSRIETGQVGATPRDVRDMLELYGVTGEQRDGLVQIAREAREKGWWHAYGDVQVTAYIGFEAEAAWIRTFEVVAVPGLLQTPAYARAVIRAARPNLGTDELERWTDRTITDPDRLRASLDEVRQRGWALVDQELEIGLRSVAAPIRRGPETIAALNVSSAVSRVSLDDLRRRILPPLVQTAETISNALTHQGPAYHRPVS
jgi:transcriptional regulator with XRE-family HTH domain